MGRPAVESALSYRPSYRRHLPHYQPAGAILFVTFRLAGSLPREKALSLMEEVDYWKGVLENPDITPERRQETLDMLQRLFDKWDDALDAANHEPRWLRNPDVASLVTDSIRYRDGKLYDLYTFCVMPNHVHLVFRPLKGEDGIPYSLPFILMGLKGYTGKKANVILGRKGIFWQRESYDKVVRDEEALLRTIEYVLNNPVKAGLVRRWEDWPWSYLRAEIL